jgi:SAM-dependent methyltransferase
MDRGVSKLHAWHTALRDEIAVAWLDPSLRGLATELAYGSLRNYLPGGSTFQSGLHAWELEIIATPPFPPAGRLLLGGAGGGRELVALRARGYDVVAFEPSEVLVAGAARAVASDPGAEVHRGSFEDLVLAVERGSGPLAGLASARFDAVVLGWGALSHVLEHDQRVALMRALRALCPTGPVLASYFTDDDPERRPRAHAPTAPRARLRAAFRRLGAPGTHSEGMAYGRVGFMHLFVDEEVAHMARESGYTVLLRAQAPFPHVVFAPDESAH